MNTTERFRANCRRLPEASYAVLFAALAKSEGHVSKFPQEVPCGGKTGQITVKQMIEGVLKNGPKTRMEVCEAIGKTKGHISAELSQMARKGIVRKDTTTDGGIQLPTWSLT